MHTLRSAERWIPPGSPAQPQLVDKTPPTPVSQVVWTPDVLQILARGDVAKGRAKAQEVCVSCHGETGFRRHQTSRILRVNPALRSTSSFMTIEREAVCIRL
jgi:hypothetical protein